MKQSFLVFNFQNARISLDRLNKILRKEGCGLKLPRASPPNPRFILDRRLFSIHCQYKKYVCLYKNTNTTLVFVLWIFTCLKDNFRVAYKIKNYLDFKISIDDCFAYLYITRNVSFAQGINKEIHNRILIFFI